MDDLKVILYVVVAIIWVVYNNYKKISEASKKRNLSLPQQTSEPVPPKTKLPQSVPAKRTEREVIEKQPRKLFREAVSRKPVPVPSPLRRKPRTERPSFISTSFSTEGGSIAPSKIVKFEEPTTPVQVLHPILQAFRNTDLRAAIIMGEVLKRPYN